MQTPNVMQGAVNNGFQNLATAKKIPSFAGRAMIELELDGHQVVITRAPAIRSIPAFARMLKTLGEVMTHTISYDDESNPEGVKLSQIFAIGMDSEEVKNFLFTHAMPQIMQSIGKAGYSDFHFFYQQLLPGCLTVDGVHISTQQELDDLCLSPPQVFQLLFKAAECNFYPTSGDLGTDDGEESPEPPQEEAKAKVKAKRKSTRRSSKKSGATGKAGQSGRTRRANG